MCSAREQFGEFSTCGAVQEIVAITLVLIMHRTNGITNERTNVRFEVR